MHETPLSIVHCANFSEKRYGQVYYSTDRKISNGLLRNGHFVQNFSYRDVARNERALGIKKVGIKRMNERLIKTVNTLSPDLLLLGHSELVQNDTLKEIKKQHPDIKLAMWWVDWLPNMLKKRAFFHERLEFLDYTFLTTDPSVFAAEFPIQNDKKKLVYMPNICDSSIETGKAYLNKSFDYDLVFIGRPDNARSKLVNVLRKEIADINLGVFGQTKETLLLGENYISVLSKSFMALNYSRDNSIPLYSSDRIIHSTGNGCLTHTPGTPKMREIFSEDEVVYFHNLEQLIENIRDSLNDKDRALEIARNGHRKAHEKYNSKIITNQILEVIFR
ncbi:glycosyltransferase [Alphaproteobacteria bacterium]|nr:glycosyltransferase [Alphaproteobacteria bacterium]